MKTKSNDNVSGTRQVLTRAEAKDGRQPDTLELTDQDTGRGHVPRSRHIRMNFYELDTNDEYQVETSMRTVM